MKTMMLLRKKLATAISLSRHSNPTLCLPLQNDEGQHAEAGAGGREPGDDQNQHGSFPG